MKNKSHEFAKLVEIQQIQRLGEQGLACEANLRNARVSVRAGRKFDNILIGGSSRFMVELSTGHIFGTKAYGVVHRGHFYGTLDTTAQWNWGDYYPQRVFNQIPDQGPVRNIPKLTFAPTPADGGTSPA
jgi:hypothetical protein